MLNELLALYPEAKQAINTKHGNPYIFVTTDTYVWCVDHEGFVMGIDLTIDGKSFPLTQFNDIAGITGYISTIVAGV